MPARKSDLSSARLVLADDNDSNPQALAATPSSVTKPSSSNTSQSHPRSLADTLTDDAPSPSALAGAIPLERQGSPSALAEAAGEAGASGQGKDSLGNAKKGGHGGGVANGKGGKDAKDGEKNGAEEGKGKDAVVIEDLTLPRSIITRLAKGVLPPNTQIQANAVMAMSKSAVVFVTHLANAANEITLDQGKKTIMPADVLRALDEIEFGFMRERVEAEFAKFNEIQIHKRSSYRKKIAATKKGDTTMGTDADATTMSNLGGGAGEAGDVSMRMDVEHEEDRTSASFGAAAAAARAASNAQSSTTGGQQGDNDDLNESTSRPNKKARKDVSAAMSNGRNGLGAGDDGNETDQAEEEDEHEEDQDEEEDDDEEDDGESEDDLDENDRNGPSRDDDGEEEDDLDGGHNRRHDDAGGDEPDDDDDSD